MRAANYGFPDNNLSIKTSSSNTEYYTIMELFNEYIMNIRFLKAVLSGFGVFMITWFVTYKDSLIPGVEPPLPFSPTRKP